MKVIEWHLIRKHNLPDTFAFWNYECYPGGGQETIAFELTGGICKPYVRGKRKGEPNYSTATDIKTFCVPVAQIPEIEAEYREITGNCPKCAGEGKLLYKWSKETGSHYRPCPHCQGTGKSIALSGVEP